MTSSAALLVEKVLKNHTPTFTRCGSLCARASEFAFTPPGAPSVSMGCTQCLARKTRAGVEIDPTLHLQKGGKTCRWVLKVARGKGGLSRTRSQHAFYMSDR